MIRKRFQQSRRNLVCSRVSDFARFRILIGLTLSIPVIANASFIYSFQVTPEANLSGNLIEPFSLSFESPDIVTAMSVLTFEPVEITDGVNSGTLEVGEALVSGGSCFLFATESSQFNSSCGSISTRIGDADVLLDVNALPSTIGQFSYLSPGALISFGNDGNLGAVELTISQNAPEPPSLILFIMAIGLQAAGWMTRLFNNRAAPREY